MLAVQGLQTELLETNAGGIHSASYSLAPRPSSSTLAHASHTRADAQFRSFDDAFVAKVIEGLPPAMRGVWDRLRPLIKRSRFSLLAWEPTVLGDAYLCAPGLSKSRLAVLPVHLPHPCIVRACSLRMSRAHTRCV